MDQAVTIPPPKDSNTSKRLEYFKFFVTTTFEIQKHAFEKGLYTRSASHRCKVAWMQRVYCRWESGCSFPWHRHNYLSCLSPCSVQKTIVSFTASREYPANRDQHCPFQQNHLKKQLLLALWGISSESILGTWGQQHLPVRDKNYWNGGRSTKCSGMLCNSSI